MGSRKQKGLPSFIHGETALSWVARSISFRTLRSPHKFRNIITERPIEVGSELEDVGIRPFLIGTDNEFDERGVLFETISQVYGVPFDVLNSYFRADDQVLTETKLRTLSCYKCLGDSMLLTGFPVWRKEWCYVTAAYCPIHFTALRAPPEAPLIQRRMWDCYLHSLWLGPRPDSLSEKRLAMMVFKSRAWFLKHSCYWPKLSPALHTLYGLFLSKRTLWASEGVAGAGFGQTQRLICRVELGLLERLKSGMHSSDGNQRGGALILIGWLAGIFSQDDIGGARRCDKQFRRSLPGSPKSLGILALRICTSKTEREYISGGLAPLRTLRLTGVDAFLDGVDFSARSR